MKLRLRVWLALLMVQSGLLAPHLRATPDVELLGPYGGDVRSLAFHPLRPGHLFLGTADGQIFLSLDAGDHWIRLEPGLRRRDLVVDNFAFHPADPNLIYVAGWELRRNQGLLARSQDGGATWEALPTGHINSQIRAIALAPSDPDVIALGVSEGVLLSRDAGRSWKNAALGYRGLQNVESLAFDPNDARILYAGTWRLGWKTTDQGEHWTAIHQGMHYDSDMFSIVVDPIQTEVLYASACTGIYKSVNGGEVWRKLKAGIPKDAHRTRTLHLDPGQPHTVYAGTTEGLFVSRDAGASWDNLIPSVVVNAVAVAPEDSRVVLVGTDDAGVLKSRDGGQTFEPANQGFIHRQVGALTVRADRAGQILVGLVQDGTHGGLFVSQDGGESWQSHNQGLEDAVASIRRILPSEASRRVFLATALGVYSGIPREASWNRIEGTGELAVNDLALGQDGNSLWIAAHQGLYRLELDSGHLQPWGRFGGKAAPVYSLLAEGSEVLAATGSGLYRVLREGPPELLDGGLPSGPVNFVKRNGPRLLAGTRQGIFMSDDGGGAWFKPASIFPLDIADLTINPQNPRHLVATDSTGGYLFESIDGGDTWKAYPPENRSRINRLSFTRSGALLAATLSEGVYRLRMPARSGE